MLFLQIHACGSKIHTSERKRSPPKWAGPFLNEDEWEAGGRKNRA